MGLKTKTINLPTTPSSPVATADNTSKWLWYVVPSTLIAVLFSILLYTYRQDFSFEKVRTGINIDFFLYILVGIIAQLIDGALGMGYGATSTSFLLALGVPPAVSSTSVHVAEMFTTGASAISHYRFGNINKKLVKHLLFPGVIASVIGAYLLSDVVDAKVIKPYIAAYMIILGIIIIIKAIKIRNNKKRKTPHLGILASFGGFMDAVGGGGWGPIVTSTLLGRGRDPRYTIGSVNAAEFGVAFASGITFLFFGGISSWQTIVGLIVGGIATAPIAALLVGKVKRRPLMIMVGCLVILLSIRTLLKSLGY